MRISREFRFEASHVLPRHEGKCGRLHGHSFRLLIELWGMVDKATGFVMDFAKLKEFVQPIVDRFDHRHLNCFVVYPSSENLAIHIAHELRSKLPAHNRLRISVSETQNTWAVWDSNIRYCRDIFDRNSLDSALDKMDAEWRSPQLNVAFEGWAEDVLVEQTSMNFVTWQAYQTEIEQRKLYQESLGKPGAIYEELKAVTKENE